MTEATVHRTNLAGASCALVAALCFSFNDLVIKFVSGGYALHQVVFLRATVGLAFFLLVIMPFAGGMTVFRTRRPGMQAVRGICVVFANSFLFLGLAALPIADAVAIFFVSPLVVTLFSVVFLRESVGPRRWGAVVMGFIGVLLIVKPGTSAFQMASVFPILAATLYALMNIIARRIGGTESAPTMTFYSLLAFLVVSTTIGLVIGDGRYSGTVHADLEFFVRAWAPVERADIWLFALLGTSGVLGVVLISQAYRLSEAAFAAPFEYVALPMAILWGVTVFGTWPDRIGWLGIALILGSGLYLVWRESRKGRAAGRGPASR